MTAYAALAEPSRRRILDLLRGGEHSVNELVTAVAASQPSVSKHLKVLREAGLVEARADGKRRLYALQAEPLAEVDAWLEPYRRARSGRPRSRGAAGGGSRTGGTGRPASMHSNDTWRRTRNDSQPADDRRPPGPAD